MARGNSSFNASATVTLNAASVTKSSKQIQQALGRITGQASEFQKSLDASTARVFAFGATTGIISGVTASFEALVTTTIEVEARLIELKSILGGSASEFSSFRDTVFQVAKDTGQSFDVVADGAAELARQGLSAEETAKRLKAALILTRVSGLDSAKSVSALTAAINGFTSAGLTAEQIVNKLTAVDQAFAVSSKDLADGFSRAGSTAEDAGVSFDELLGIITAVQQTTSRGGAVIGNALKSIFTRLGRGSTIEDLQALGVAIDASQTGTQKLQSLADALAQISDPTKAAAIKELAGGVYQINLVSAALKDLQSSNSLFSQATLKSAQATNEAYGKNEQLNESLKSQLNALVAGITNLGEKVGQLTFAPILKQVISLATNISDFFDKALDPEKGNAFIQGLFKTIGAFLNGPAVILFTAAFVKIFTLVARYAKEGFKSILEIGTQTEKVKNIEQGISVILAKNEVLHNQINDSLVSDVEKHRLILQAIKEQNAAYEYQKKIQQDLAKYAFASGVRGVKGDQFVGKGGKTFAQGFVPSFGEMMERKKAKEHGYTAGKVKQTRIHDGNGKSFNSFVNSREQIKTFTNAAGKKATIVRPPNGFGKGTEYAASGFVPNFADENSFGYKNALRNLAKLSENQLLAKISAPRSTPEERAAAQYILSQKRSGNFKATDFVRQLDAERKIDTGARPTQIAGAIKLRDKESSTRSLLVANKIESLEEFDKRAGAGKSIVLDGKTIYRADAANYLGRKAQTSLVTTGEAQAKRAENFIDTYNLDANKLGGILLVSPRFGLMEGEATARMEANKINAFYNNEALSGAFNKKDDLNAKRELVTLRGIKKTGVPKAGKDVLGTSRDINELFAPAVVGLAGRLYGDIFDVGDRKEFAQKLGGFKSSTTGGILSAAAEGSIFEAASKVALSSMKEMPDVFDSSNENRPFDFSNAGAMQKIFGVNTQRGEAKRLGSTDAQDQINGVLTKVFNDPVYGQRATSEILAQRASSANRELAAKKQAEDLAKRAEKTKNSAGGFVPNFASFDVDSSGKWAYKKHKLLGEGQFGAFFQLRNNKRGDSDFGVKKFKGADNKDKESASYQDIAEEYAISKLMSENQFVAGITAPKVIGTLERSVAAKRIGKQVISDPLGHRAIGDLESEQLGYVMQDLLASAGIKARDLHGSNYTLNSAATKVIRKDDSYLTSIGRSERTLPESKSFFGDIASKGGLANIIDTGYMEPTTPNLIQKYLDYRGIGFPSSPNSSTKRSSSYSGNGFIPNFARGPKSKFDRLNKGYIFPDGEIFNASDHADAWDDMPSGRDHKSAIKYVAFGNQVTLQGKLNKSIFDTFSKFGISGGNIRYGSVDDEMKALNEKAIQDKLSSISRQFVDIGGGYKARIRSYKGTSLYTHYQSPDGKLYEILGGIEPEHLKIEGGIESFINRVQGRGDIKPFDKKNLERLNESSAFFASGFIPNFSAVKDAIAREKSFGLSDSQIYVSQNPALRSSANPNGLGVFNTRDEPNGPTQGINRAKREGKNPRTYGMGGGFVPNFAPLPLERSIKRASEFSPPKIKDFFGGKFNVAKVEEFQKSLDLLFKSFQNGNIQLQELVKTAQSIGKAVGLTGDSARKFKEDFRDALFEFSNFKGGIKTGFGKASKLPDIRGVGSVQAEFAAARPKSSLGGALTPFSDFKKGGGGGLSQRRNRRSLADVGIEVVGSTLVNRKRGPKDPRKSFKFNRSVSEERSRISESFSKTKDSINKEGGIFNKFESSIGKVQGSLFGLSFAANSLLDETSTLLPLINGAVTALSSFSLLTPILPTIFASLKAFGVSAGLAGTALLAIPAALAGVAGYFVGSEANKGIASEEAAQESIYAESRQRASKITLSRTAKEAGVKDLDTLSREVRGTKFGEELAKAQKSLKAAYAEGDDVKIEESRQLLIQALKSAAESVDPFVVETERLKVAANALGNAFIDQSSTINSAIEKFALRLDKQSQAESIAKNVTTREDSPFGARLEKILTISSAKTEAQKSGTSFLQTFTGKDGIAGLIKERANREDVFSISGSSIAVNQKSINESVASGQLQNQAFNSFIQGGSSALKKVIEGAIGTIDGNEKGQEFYDKVLSSAEEFKSNVVEGYQSAKNIQLQIENDLVKNRIDFVKAVTQSITNLPSDIAGITGGEKVDPLTLFKKFEEAAKLLNSGKTGDAQKGSNILASISDASEAFKKLFGENALLDLQTKAGLSGADVTKARGAASAGQIDFAAIQESIRKNLSGNDLFRTSKALKEAQADPSKINALIEELKKSGTTKFRGGEGADIIASLSGVSKANFEDEATKNLNDQQKALSEELSLVSAQVKAFREAFKGNTLVTTVDALTANVRAASENLKDFTTFTSQLSSLSSEIGPRLNACANALRQQGASIP